MLRIPLPEDDGFALAIPEKPCKCAHGVAVGRERSEPSTATLATNN